MEIPGPLLDAQAAVEVVWARHAAERQKTKDILAAGAQASARAPEVDREITALTGTFLRMMP